MKLLEIIRQVIHKLIPYRSIEQAEQIESVVSPEMQEALNNWYEMYLGKPSWAAGDSQNVKTMNLPPLICSELARQICLEMKWNITGKTKDGGTRSDTGETLMNPRADYLKAEFNKLMIILRQKLEQGLAAGGMIIKPYPNVKDGHIYFSFSMDWGFYPLAFDASGRMTDVVFSDVYVRGKTFYTRLERHKVKGKDVEISHKVYKSNMPDSLGTEIGLGEIEQWSSLQPTAVIKNADGQMFGWYKVASANSVDIDSPMGASIYSKAVDTIKEADMQYSRLLWEYEGSELAIDVDPTVLKSNKDQKGYHVPRLNERLFRAVDMGQDDTYKVFSPPIRDNNLINGLNRILVQVEALCGLARGTISDANIDARTATELNMIRQRTYATVSDNQAALERCLRDVIRAMDKYATIYKLAEEGEYDVSFEWDDSIISDIDSETNKRLSLLNLGIIGKSEFREWYFGETPAQAEDAIKHIQAENIAMAAGLIPDVSDIRP